MAESHGLSDENLHREALLSRFLQAFNADKIEEDVYHLKKPYFEILASLEIDDPDFLKEVDENFRYDLFNNILVFKMSPPTQQHGAVASELTVIIAEELYSAGLRLANNFTTFALTKAIRSRGSGRVQYEDYVLHPDAQFGVAAFIYPGVVVEVGWSQKWGGRAGLQEKMCKLLAMGNGETRVAIGVEMNVEKGPVFTTSGVGALSISLSLWRLESSHGSDAIKVIHDRVRAYQFDGRVLSLKLRDFAHPRFFEEEFIGADLDTTINLPFRRIYDATLMGYQAYLFERRESERKMKRYLYPGNGAHTRFHWLLASLRPGKARKQHHGYGRYSPSAYRLSQIYGSVGGILSRFRRFPL